MPEILSAIESHEQQQRRPARVEFVAPRTQTEELVAGIWQRVLRRELIGIHDNFFDLGGHSLTATRVLSRVRDLFDVELELESLFDAPLVPRSAQSR